jgi:acetoacetyl-CoA reductase
LNDEKIISQPRLELLKMKCPVSRRAFSSYASVFNNASNQRLSFVKRPGQFRRIKKTTKEDYDMARVALVTGGTRGIGAAISKALKAAGYKVAASYAGNDAAAEKFKSETGIPVYKWDVSSFDACAEGIKKVEGDLGPVDVLVNNAGITKDGAFHKMTLDQWNAVINTNLGSLFNMTRPVIEGMRARKFGRIINISSINGQKGQFGQVNYSAAKAGDIGFTKALALENAKGGITVNAICPGYINTEMVQAVPKDVLEKSILPLIPVNRLGEPEEIARAVVFLAADEAGGITGSTMTVNGGQYMV